MKLLKHTTEHIQEVVTDPCGDIKTKFKRLAIPIGSLGRLEELATVYISIRGSVNCTIKHKTIFTMAGDHGVAEEGVSAFPQQVTRQMVQNFMDAGAAINVLARHVGAKVVVVDCGVATHLNKNQFSNQCQEQDLRIKKVGLGTKNITIGPAMSRDEAIQALEVGIELVEEELKNGLDIVGTGDMGIANTTPSSAILAVLGKLDVETVTGRGTGLDEEALQRKIRIIKKAIDINQPDPHDPIDVLAKVGGYEIGGIAGLCLGAARHRIPIVLDGFISTAGALIAHAIEPKVKGHLIASHISAEKGHKLMLKLLDKIPLLDLNLRLGEGTGAALGINLIEASIKLLNEMATFQEAGVSEPNRE
ncbi:MAG: nicotinate-nucleotide--dimethylbenzimidazole phosphoribosyltransferase [Candidatus Jettenia sp.]|uniref:Nicotinate-nucleotide--dimethylbenzimidazole phosphoribosyltransferase n=1 Tax=Candidatus Jettenia caeni TaxID=247490 RepID=I3IMV4_9BACT|nr:nicotinate-nucleotide--dimethylbenzimidazole phosphoribosyltransferase [Candidatus Jettenia sp. AMX1]MBC6928698.1 nicotinate-nucleotide--dimethylbenzimidazole phosphoribosyltransferase [Candidatus Jettenia sp.]WKZ14800.1 MAG: nicotinate-nucleotide--dimethylbenzimidazole phosphoribosyltransferase [Candidatus Jettenia caeni]KAA0250674.1 MAG: nicotinate-nucleotide--dimethylbenzimidazole phosphoribosyltransferase [Candidatus Jettenia sp. AMX1]MCE7880010.1 nicotinate-nucleotide--dimethylbenzimida